MYCQNLYNKPVLSNEKDKYSEKYCNWNIGKVSAFEIKYIVSATTRNIQDTKSFGVELFLSINIIWKRLI